MYRTIILTFMATISMVEVILYFLSERKLRKHLEAPRNRHWEQEHELLKQDNKECASAMLIVFVIELLTILTF